MRILFNLLGTGLGNNGGSLTIVKSANTLAKLGHDVKVIDGGPNKMTWVKLEVPHVIVRDIAEIPDADAIIGTGINSLLSTELCKVKRKVMWIRGWELWKVSTEENLALMLQSSKAVKVVNSLCLRKKLASFGIESTIIRPGFDFDEIFPLDIRKDHYPTVVIGGLYNQGSKRKTKRTEWIFQTYAALRSSNLTVELAMFGSEGTPSFSSSFVFLRNPTTAQKNVLYNRVDIWLAPSELEGLHVAPGEAMLTGCPVVSTAAEMSGTQDYLVDRVTGLVSLNDLDDFIYCVKELAQDPVMRQELGRNAIDKVRSLGSREENMKKFAQLLEEL